MQLGDIRILQEKRPDLMTRLGTLTKEIGSNVPPHVLQRALKDTRRLIADPFAQLTELLDQVETGTFVTSKQNLPMAPGEALIAYQRNPQDRAANIALMRWGLTGAEDPNNLEEVYL